MKKVLFVFFLWIGYVVVAQETAVPVHLDLSDNERLTLSWESKSNEVYQVLFTTNLTQRQTTTLTDDVFATPPTNRLTVHRGRVPSAFFRVEVQHVLGDVLEYEKISPNSPAFVGTFCITNAVQFDALKDELGLSGETFDFSSEVVVGTMSPLTPSIGGHYRMDSVRETDSEVLVCYFYESYYPYSNPAFTKDILIVKIAHRNKPVRLVFRGTIFSNYQGPSWDFPVSIDSATGLSPLP